MANGGQWDPISLPKRPGLYINFVERALAQIVGGPRGVVGMPIFEYTGGEIESGEFMTVEGEKAAILAVVKENASPAIRALARGAAEVLLYAVPAPQIPESDYDYAGIREAFEARPFNVFVYPGAVTSTEQESTRDWTARNRKDGKHFTYVTGGSAEDDQDPDIGNARSILLADEYVINLINGAIDSSGNELPSEEYAVDIAGLIAGTPINQSITYQNMPIADTNKRLTNAQTIEALNSGSLVLTNDGRNVKIEQGITTKSTASQAGKIRAMRARQAIATDIPAVAKDHYIGKVNNNRTGQQLLIAAIMQYLETLVLNNVLHEGVYAGMDPERESKGDCVFLVIDGKEVDSMERIFLTFGV
ncbi:phage tail sheath protein [Sporosarcina sp. P18a]|uniref:phage tail sheath subtilisin-like domain-containing protein n=1 Tax=Sporosarcina sp. P18a TaxID=2048259 RepID=UPI000C172AFC|nr:phage tail sheath subtilisin-like domain-containing protein [Sporosarcina sp. P18a]PIC81030.1 phage tail sheath protein [Sporosarcina sp. P18a]